MNGLRVYADACCHVPDAHVKNRIGRGLSACGVVLVDEGDRIIAEYSAYLGEATVPEAEFRALILALDKTVAHTRGCVDVYMDSELVVKWMNGEYRIRRDHIKPLFDEAKQLEYRYKSVRYYHHPRTAHFAMAVDRIAKEEFAKSTGKRL